MPDLPSKFYAYLKGLPPPFSYVGATIEFLARLLGLRFALLLLAGHSLGIMIVIALIVLDKLPFKEHLYVSKAAHEHVLSELSAMKAKLETLNDAERKLKELQDHVSRAKDPQYRLWLEYPENGERGRCHL
jgi:hypothetical protein